MNFTRKAIWVKDGYRTPNPTTPNYAGVVSRESIHILLPHADIHRVYVKAADLHNEFLQAPTYKKHYIICRPEFGIENGGKRAVIVQELDGGKYTGSDFWNHLRSCMDHLGFELSKNDPYFRMSCST